MKMFNLKRLGQLALVLVLAAPLATPAAAEQASKYVTSLANDAITVIQDPDVAKDEKTQKIQDLFVSNFDLPFISRFVLAQYWRSASAEQREKFQEVFTEWATKTLASRFQDYTGGPLTVTGEQVADDENTVVTSEVSFEGKAIQLNWALHKNDDSYLIRDVTAAGVSQIITQKDEFVSVMQRNGGVDGLISILEKKLAQN